MVLARSDQDHKRIKVLSQHGLSRDAWNRFGSSGYRHYQVTEAGFKYNMMDLQAVIGVEQLRQVDSFWRRRKQIWSRYQESFADLPLRLPAEPEPDTRHAYHLYTMMVDEARTGLTRDAFLNAMTAQNIGVGVHYLSIPDHPYYQKTYGWDISDYPHALKIGRQTVSLPLTSKMTDRDVEDVVAAVLNLIQ
jgi:dTDP-4-amino-4,6-dideoxygalactose transaminase